MRDELAYYCIRTAVTLLCGKVVDIACAPSRNTWAANIEIVWLPYSNEWENKFGHKSELKVNSKIRQINLLVFAHSACPYKNCGLKRFTEG